MKKLLVVLALLLTLTLVGCAEQRDARIPIDDPDYIIFYNGGSIIYEAYKEDGEITVRAEKIATVTVSWSKDTAEYWLVYYITQNGVTTKIVDSDTLSIIWED